MLKINTIVYLKETHTLYNGSILKKNVGYELISLGNIKHIIHTWVDGYISIPNYILITEEEYISKQRSDKIDKIINEVEN